MTAKAAKSKLTVDEFLPWALAQERGRYELVDGEIVAMTPERARHVLVKTALARTLQDGVKAAGLLCTAYGDGLTVVIDQHHSREPDASVQCGTPVDLDSLVLDAPLIVCEVTSPSSERDDSGLKLVEYFSVPSIVHYLIVRPEQQVVIHHQRALNGEIRTRIVSDGAISLDPPGFTIPVAPILAAGL